MRSFQHDLGGNHRSGADRLDTPASTGFRHGMSCSGMIGRKLDSLYRVPAETPGAIQSLLVVIERKFARGR